MTTAEIPGVLTAHQKLFTVNLSACKGTAVYGEKLQKIHGKEYRAWSPYRSKFAAALLRGLTPDIASSSHILYLGAATGTTVSHVSDIVRDGMVYAIEQSAIAAQKLLTVSEKRSNVIPILADANHPDTYSAFVPHVDFIYQDISQRNQAAIFCTNVQRYLKPQRQGLIMIKARSIDVSLPPKTVYAQVAKYLTSHDLSVVQTYQLEPYKKDHACILVER